MVHNPSSLGCTSSFAQLIVRPSRRGGVPVFRRAIGNPAPRIWSASLSAEDSPIRPPSNRSSPRNNFPPRKVPVAKMTAEQAMLHPSARSTPTTRWALSGAKRNAAASPSTMVKLGCAASCLWIDVLNKARSAWIRGPCTAAPLDALSIR